MQKKYDIIYSLGRDCACSDYMKKSNLRICSGPFDWLTNAQFEKRIDLILNDFDGFLNLEYFRFLTKDPNVFNDDSYDYYENIKTDFYFYHDFPANISFEKSFEKVKEKYERRIKRFYKNIKEKEKVLLIWFSHYHQTSDEILKNLCSAICKKMEKNIDFLIIEHQENLTKPKITEVAPNIIKYNLHTVILDDKNLPTTLGNEDLCLPIFKQYSLILPIKTRLKKVAFSVFLKIISLIPIRKVRKSLKNKLKE